MSPENNRGPVEENEIQKTSEATRFRHSHSGPAIDDAAIDGLKFSECLPGHLAVEMLEERLSDSESTNKILEQHERYVAK